MSTWTIPTAHISEAAFQRKVTDLCDWLHLTWHHETDSRRTRSGFPDLVICGSGGIIFAELKREGAKPTTAQKKWLLAVELADTTGVEAVCWRPSDWPHIEARLRDLAAKGGAR